MNNEFSSDTLYSIIDKAKLTPYVHNGRTLNEGFDCLGFIIYFYSELGITLPSNDGSDINPGWFTEDPYRFVRGLKNLNFEPIKKIHLRPLDLALFSVFSQAITHSGILLPGKKFVHMSPKSGLIVSKFERHWYRRCHGGFRIIPY